MATQIYPNALIQIHNNSFNLGSDTFRALLVDGNGAYNRAHTVVSSVTGDELSDATRIDLGAITVTDNGTNRVVVDFPNIVFPTQTTAQTVGACIVYKFVTDDAGSIPWIFLDGTNITTDGTNVTVTINATDGGYYYTYA